MLREPELLKPRAICFGDWGVYIEAHGLPGCDFIAPLTPHLALHFRRQEPGSSCFLVAGVVPTATDSLSQLPSVRGVLWAREAAVEVDATFKKIEADDAARSGEAVISCTTLTTGASMPILTDPDSILDLAVRLSLARDVRLHDAVEEILAARSLIKADAAKSVTPAQPDVKPAKDELVAPMSAGGVYGWERAVSVKGADPALSAARARSAPNPDSSAESPE